MCKMQPVIFLIKTLDAFSTENLPHFEITIKKPLHVKIPRFTSDLDFFTNFSKNFTILFELEDYVTIKIPSLRDHVENNTGSFFTPP